MTEPSPEDAAALRAAEQVRLRKERREAKIKAGGAARLNKINGLSGRDPEPTPSASPAPKAASTTEHADPEEVDISEHFYEPAATRRPNATSATPPMVGPSEEQLRQMMLGFEAPGQQQQQQFTNNPFGAGPGAQEDPMMQMLSQMMAGGGMPDGAAGAFPSGFPGFPGMGAQQSPAKTSSAAYLWRLVHALFALTLGIYIASTTRFSGAKAQRERTAMAFAYPAATSDGIDALDEVELMEEGREVFFWMFATAEALLITTRFIIDGGKPPAGAGIAWTVSGFLPEPWKTRLETVLRYGQVFSSVRRDILVCVFVLGVATWVRA